MMDNTTPITVRKSLTDFVGSSVQSGISKLQEELDQLKAENAQLREWLSWGKYSAR